MGVIMYIPTEIIDNSNENNLINFFIDALNLYPNTNLDIATAFFNIEAFSMIKEHFGNLKSFRLLLGTPPGINSKITLGDLLLNEIKEEIEGFDLIKENSKTIEVFIKFLKQNNVQIRLYEKFLHGKAYIFDDLVVIGSSNFTSAGLTRYGELNTWAGTSKAVYTRNEWFEKFWIDSNDFKNELIKILEESRFGSKEYSPYDIYIKTLYELQKDDILKDDIISSNLPETKVNLAEFQEDAITRIWTRLQKYGGCMVADSVGLGKTWTAKKILEKIGYYERKNVLVICPAQLREMWKTELKKIDVKENVISQEDLGSKDFIQKAKKAVGGQLDTIELVVVDESHNFRNPLSNRWENFFTLVNDHVAVVKRPYMLFLTATPINNTHWDLYQQIILLVLGDRTAFIKENIKDLFLFFKKAENNPSILNDLLNEISIRRTRDYIINNYPDAYINIELPNGEIKEEKIIFPRRNLENIVYKLDDAYKGLYKEISDLITEKLTMAYYKILEYRVDGVLTEEEIMTLGRMIGIGGIFRTILLKRLESSIESFKISVSKHVNFLKDLKIHLDDGKLLTKKAFHKYLMILDDELNDSPLITELEDFNKDLYDIERLFDDIDKDINIFNQILEKINSIKPADDSKLIVLKEKLIELSKTGQIVLFTYYADTLNYIFQEIRNDNRFKELKIEGVSSSGMTGKSPSKRSKIVQDFHSKEIDILMSTDVLSEGQNLQSAKYLINYDLHWNPTRMIQRAGRIDRIGSPYNEIFVYNFFPEDELEELLKLVQKLQGKIIEIDESVGLDQTVLGEEIHPKVFGIIRRIKNKDSKVLDELEKDAYAGGEKFYQPLKDFLKDKGVEELKKIPNGVYSGLKDNKISGIFFYYKYSEDFNYWYLYDLQENSMLKNKTAIIDYISCNKNKSRSIPNFFERVYEINLKVFENIKDTYTEIYWDQTQSPKIAELVTSRSTKFIVNMIDDIDSQIIHYLDEFPNDKSVKESWKTKKDKLICIYPSKRRLKELRRLWREYKVHRNWKMTIENINDFLKDKKDLDNKILLKPFDKNKLKLIAIDFIS